MGQLLATCKADTRWLIHRVPYPERSARRIKIGVAPREGGRAVMAPPRRTSHGQSHNTRQRCATPEHRADSRTPERASWPQRRRLADEPRCEGEASPDVGATCPAKVYP